MHCFPGGFHQNKSWSEAVAQQLIKHIGFFFSSFHSSLKLAVEYSGTSLWRESTAPAAKQNKRFGKTDFFFFPERTASARSVGSRH